MHHHLTTVIAMMLLIVVVVASSSTSISSSIITTTSTNRSLAATSTSDSYPSNMYCNFTSSNTTVTWLGKTREQRYAANKNDNNCTVCIKIGCVWCSSSSSPSTGYCYNGHDYNSCNKENDVPIDSQSTCNNNSVSLVVFLLTIFLGIVLPILLLCTCFSCVVYFARRYIKSRQCEQRVVPVEAEACSNTDHHMYTFVVDAPVLIQTNNDNDNDRHVNTSVQTAHAYEYKDNDDRLRVVHAIAIPMNR